MRDSLKYRIPGSSVVELNGTVIPLQSMNDFTGLILSNFEGTQLFGFVENKFEENDLTPFYPTLPYSISKEDYLKLAQDLISELNTQELNKVILSRIKKVALNQMNQDDLFNRLLDNYPTAFVYSIKSELVGNWVGATPERLIEYKDGIGKTISLAGTKLSSNNEEWGEKERLEQLYVTQFVEEKLTQFATNVTQKEVKEQIAGPVKHLVTHFDFEIKSSDVLKLASDLHPTPAVSGLPRSETMKLIANYETHERRLYAGIIGVIGKSEINLFVNLRSCQICDSNAYLYVGGGLTIDSIPALEWEETENKALTIMNVLQNK